MICTPFIDLGAFGVESFGVSSWEIWDLRVVEITMYDSLSS